MSQDDANQEENNNDNGSRYEFEAIMEEYKSLRADMLSHSDGLMQTVLYSLIIFFAAVPVIIPLVERGFSVILLAIPLPFSGLNWLLQWRVLSILVTGFYIRTMLTPKMNTLLQQLNKKHEKPGIRNIWEWEDFLALTEVINPRKAMVLRIFGVFNILINLVLWLPSIVSLIIFFFIRFNSPWQAYEIAIFVFDSLITLSVIFTAILAPAMPRAYQL